jgi:hypothetical protein
MHFDIMLARQYIVGLERYKGGLAIANPTKPACIGFMLGCQKAATQPAMLCYKFCLKIFSSSLYGIIGVYKR